MKTYRYYDKPVRAYIIGLDIGAYIAAVEDGDRVICDRFLYRSESEAVDFFRPCFGNDIEWGTTGDIPVSHNIIID